MLAAVREEALGEFGAESGLARSVRELQKRGGRRLRERGGCFRFRSVGDEERVVAAIGAGSGPTEMDLQAGVGAFEVVKILGMDGAARELLDFSAEAGGRARGAGGAEEVKSAKIVFDAGVGNGAEAEGFPALMETALNLGDGIGGGRLEGDGAGWLGGGADAKDGVVAVAGHFVVGAAAAEGDADVRDAGEATAEREKPGRREDELGSVHEAAVDAVAQLGDGEIVRSLKELDGGSEGGMQRQAADVADEDVAAVADEADGVFEDLSQIGGVGKVLDDGVDDDGVEGAGLKAGEVVGGAMHQLDAGRLTGKRVELRANVGEDLTGEVHRDVAVAVRGHVEEGHAGAAADFVDGAGAEAEDAVDGGLHPVAHVLLGEGAAGVARVPANGIEAGSRSGGFGRLIEVVDSLPFADGGRGDGGAAEGAVEVCVRGDDEGEQAAGAREDGGGVDAGMGAQGVAGGGMRGRRAPGAGGV